MRVILRSASQTIHELRYAISMTTRPTVFGESLHDNCSGAISAFERHLSLLSDLPFNLVYPTFLVFQKEPEGDRVPGAVLFDIGSNRTQGAAHFPVMHESAVHLAIPHHQLGEVEGLTLAELGVDPEPV